MTDLKEHLQYLAAKYETADFINGDPSWFMHQYDNPVQQECAAFIAAALSYGSRKQFLPKIESLLQSISAPFPIRETFAEGQNVGKGIEASDLCFYRLHTNRMVRHFLDVTDGIYAEFGSILGLMQAHNIHTCIDAVRLITNYFAERQASDLIPKNAQSSCKRICMFLRWMVRDNSPVDLGLWKDQIDKRTLIMPMDTHVLQEAQKLGLIASKTGSMSTAIKLTNKLKEFFPDDPLKGDFALFGLGTSPIPSQGGETK